MKRLPVIFLVSAMMVACSDRPADIIPESEMVEILADIQIAEAYERNGNAGPEFNGANRELIGRGVLMDHGVSVEEMDSTLAWYGRNMDEYSKLYKKVDQRLAALQQKYAKAAGESDNGGPSTDLWPYGRHLVVDRNQLTQGLVVNIQLPDISPGDRLMWKMRTHGATRRRLILGVDYDDGRSEIVDNSNSSPELWVETSLQTDTLAKVKRIFAMLDVEHTVPRVFIDSIQLLHYPFSIEEFHKSGYQRKIGAPARKIVEVEDSTKKEKQDTLAVAPPAESANAERLNLQPQTKTPAKRTK